MVTLVPVEFSTRYWTDVLSTPIVASVTLMVTVKLALYQVEVVGILAETLGAVLSIVTPVTLVLVVVSPVELVALTVRL